MSRNRGDTIAALLRATDVCFLPAEDDNTSKLGADVIG